MHKFFKLVTLAALAVHLGACGNKSAQSHEFYGDMSESDQSKYMADLIAALNTPGAQANPNPKIENPIFTGDSQRDIIIATSTYHKTVPPKQVEKAKAILAKSPNYITACYNPEATSLTRIGISFQAVLKDPAGTVIWKSEMCEGATFAPRPYAEMTPEQKVIALNKIVKGFEAYAAANALSPKISYTSRFRLDIEAETIFETRQLKSPIPKSKEKMMRAEIAAAAAENVACQIVDIKDLNKNGLSYVINIEDSRGQVMTDPIICAAQSSDSGIPKLRGMTASR